VDWMMVAFGVLLIVLGILSSTSVITSPIYREARWFMVLLGVVALLWGILSGRRR